MSSFSSRREGHEGDPLADAKKAAEKAFESTRSDRQPDGGHHSAARNRRSIGGTRRTTPARRCSPVSTRKRSKNRAATGGKYFPATREAWSSRSSTGDFGYGAEGIKANSSKGRKTLRLVPRRRFSSPRLDVLVLSRSDEDRGRPDGGEVSHGRARRASRAASSPLPHPRQRSTASA